VALEIDARYDGNAQPRSSGTISGLLIIGGVQITVTASRLSQPSGGWQLEGHTSPDEDIPFGTFLTGLMDMLGSHAELPSSIAELNIENLAVSFETANGDFTFTCEAKLPVGEKSLDVIVMGELKQAEGVYTKSFSGHITVGTVIFDLHFDIDKDSKIFLASYSKSDSQLRLIIKELVENVSSTVAGYVPPGLEIELEDALFAFGKDATETKFLFGLDVGASINLSNLPLVGMKFAPDQTVSVDDLRLLVSSKGWNRQEAIELNKLIPDKMTRLPEQFQDDSQNPTADANDGSSDPSTTIAIPEGITFSAQMNFGGSKSSLSLAATKPSAAADKSLTPTAAAPPADAPKWFTLQKTFGPLHLDKVGVQYQDGELWFLLVAALSAAGLTILLDSLSIGSPINRFSPEFRLRGLGIDYDGGAVEIGAAFLRTQAIAPDGTNYDEYDGTAVIKTKPVTLSAFGSYAELDGHPSLFIYAFLDYPLGGQPSSSSPAWPPGLATTAS
jgi:hypothetical protein